MIARILLAACIVAAVAANAQDFSADMVSEKSDDGGTKGKVYVSGDKMRFESTRANERGGVMIWNTAENKRVVLMPERKLYMDFGDVMPGSIMSFWRPTNIENACPEWQRAAQQWKDNDNKIASCNKVGHDVVNGRPAVKYEGTSMDGKKSQVWLDVKVRAVVKAVNNEGGGMELQNIQQGSQPASLFEVPSDYQKFDMNSMRKNRQH